METIGLIWSAWVWLWKEAPIMVSPGLKILGIVALVFAYKIVRAIHGDMQGLHARITRLEGVSPPNTALGEKLLGDRD